MDVKLEKFRQVREQIASQIENLVNRAGNPYPRMDVMLELIATNQE
jgi:hypothetical protein